VSGGTTGARDWDAATHDRLEAAGEPLVLDYVRLNMAATRVQRGNR